MAIVTTNPCGATISDSLLYVSKNMKRIPFLPLDPLLGAIAGGWIRPSWCLKYLLKPLLLKEFTDEAFGVGAKNVNSLGWFQFL